MLAHDLRRVLFKPGVHLLRDFQNPKRFHFSRFLQTVHQPHEVS